MSRVQLIVRGLLCKATEGIFTHWAEGDKIQLAEAGNNGLVHMAMHRVLLRLLKKTMCTHAEFSLCRDFLACRVDGMLCYNKVIC